MNALLFGTPYAPMEGVNETIENRLSIDNSKQFQKQIETLVTNKKVIELGTRDRPNSELFKFNPKEYVCVEVTDIKPDITKLPEFVRYENGVDALTYLKENVEKNSSTFISSGFFDKCILDEDYALQLIIELYKKTTPGGLNIHTMWDYHDCFESVGFETISGGNVDIAVYRKPDEI